MKQYYGYVYIWFDTKKKKYLIGSHHGTLEDGYKTSTGGIHVRNIFKSRPHTMRMKVLEYNTEKNDRKATLLLEQKWLDKRPNITDNPRYYNKTNKAGGGFDREIQLKRVRNGTHHFLGGKIQIGSNLKRVKEGTHNLLDGEVAKKNALRRIKEGTHHFLSSDFNKKPFKIYFNNILINEFASKVDAVNAGYPAHLIDKLRKHGRYKCQRNSYKDTNVKYKIGDIFTYISS
jgi:hypothetical protein